VQEWLALDKLKPADYSAISYERGRVFYKKTLGGENVANFTFVKVGTGRKSCSLIRPCIKPV